MYHYYIVRQTNVFVLSNLHLIPKKRLHIIDLSKETTSPITQGFFLGLLGLTVLLIAVVGFFCYGSLSLVLRATAGIYRTYG